MADKRTMLAAIDMADRRKCRALETRDGLRKKREVIEDAARERIVASVNKALTRFGGVANGAKVSIGWSAGPGVEYGYGDLRIPLTKFPKLKMAFDAEKQFERNVQQQREDIHWEAKRLALRVATESMTPELIASVEKFCDVP